MLNVFFSLFLVGILLSFNHSDRVVLSLSEWLKDSKHILTAGNQ